MTAFPNACQDCQRDEAGVILALCPEGRRLHEIDTATPAGSSPEVYRQFALHVWGVGQPPMAALGVPIPDGLPYPDRHAWQDESQPLPHEAAELESPA